MVSPIMNLNQVVLRAINGFASGETKDEAVNTVTQFVKDNYFETVKLADIGMMSATQANQMHEKNGFEVCINDGKFQGFKIGQFRKAGQVRIDAS